MPWQTTGIKYLAQLKDLLGIVLFGLITQVLIISNATAESFISSVSIDSSNVSESTLGSVKLDNLKDIYQVIASQTLQLQEPEESTSHLTKNSASDKSNDNSKNSSESSKNNITESTKEWQNIAPGIEYLALENLPLNIWAHIHAFRINLKHNFLSLTTTQDIPNREASIINYAKQAKSLIAINGGFFDDHHHPLGLRISERRQVTPLKKISWWGVFYIKNKKAYIVKKDDFHRNNSIEFAVQSGPRLIVNNRIPSLKPGKAQRSALGITKEGHLIVIITDKKPISTTELAHLMQASPLNCVNAINLDGGNSSQLHVDTGSFLLHVHGFSRISDAILVKART